MLQNLQQRAADKQDRSVFDGVGVAVVLPPLNFRRFPGVAVQLPPQQTSHFEELIGPALTRFRASVGRRGRDRTAAWSAADSAAYFLAAQPRSLFGRGRLPAGGGHFLQTLVKGRKIGRILGNLITHGRSLLVQLGQNLIGYRSSKKSGMATESIGCRLMRSR
jgi:hypothetical protein